jgi:hypothetical protein
MFSDLLTALRYAVKNTNDVQLARNQERLRLEQINNEIKDSLVKSISELNETIKTLKIQQENDILKLNKQHENATREITIRYNQRFQELTSDLQNSSNKIVVQDLRLKKVNNENKTLNNSLQHSHMLCANMISLLKSADHFILREHRKKQLLVDGLTYITNEYSNTYSRKSALESYFGGLALKNGSPSSSNAIDLLNHNTPIPSINKADIDESKKATHLTNRLGLSPRHTSQTPKPYLSLYNIHSGNDMRRGMKKSSILLHSPARPQNANNSRSMFNVKRSKSIKRLKSKTASPKRSMNNVILGKHLNDKHDGIYNNKTVPGGGNMYSSSSSSNSNTNSRGSNHAVNNNEKVSLKQQQNMVKFNTLSYLSTSTVSYKNQIFDVTNQSKIKNGEESILHQSIPLINLKSYNILIIEFNQNNLQSLTNTLKKIGIGQSNIMTARTESVARSILDTKVIDLIFIRYWMPNSSIDKPFNVIGMVKRLLKDKTYVLQISNEDGEGESAQQQQEQQVRLIFEQNLKSLQHLLRTIKVIVTYDPLCVEEQDAIFASDPSGHRLTQAWAGGSQRQIVEPIITSNMSQNNILSNATLKLPIDGEPQRIDDLKMKLYNIFLMNDVQA